MIPFSFCFVQLSDGLNAVPMTEREKRECSLVLSPQQLKLVDIGNCNKCIFTQREPDVYKPHGFLLSFLATFICFCVTVLFYCYMYFVVKEIYIK